MSSEPGLLLVLSAPSGAGKTTLAHRFRAAHPDAVFSVSVTTRAPRGAERDGVDYHFVTPERFAQLVAEGAFAEWAEVHGQRYGTLRSTVDEALGAGRIALFDIDVEGGAQLEATWPRESASYCGNCIAVCPTGALMATPEFELRQAGEWRPETQAVTDTICPYCGVGCTLTVHVQDQQIVKVTSPFDNDVTRGNLCVKGRFGFEYVNRTDR
jgi:ferredoxin